jgi:hypothetical protein
MSAFFKLLSAVRPADYSISTWLFLGATLQCILLAILPRNIALLPPITLLLFRMLRGYLTAIGKLSNQVASNTTHGRQTWQIPSADNTLATTGSQSSIVVLVLAASWSHPNGRFSPGSSTMGAYMSSMWTDASSNRSKYGFLGNTPPLSTQEDPSRPDSQGKTEVYISYWKTLEGLHKFAHGNAHMKGQLWWEKGAMEEFPHLGVMHEVYEVPAGAWENVFHNYQPFGICKWELFLRVWDMSTHGV